jgi:pyruvate kinase
LKIIATINPAVVNEKTAELFKKYNVDIIRINGAHIDINFFNDIIKQTRDCFGSEVKLLIDLPGNKIRTANITEPIEVKNNEKFYLYRNQFNYLKFFDIVRINDTILANDGLYTFKVLDIVSDKIIFKSYSNGKLSAGKGMHLVRTEALKDLPLLFEKDIELINKSIENNIDYIGVSFIRNKDDVLQINKLVQNTNVQPIFKIETKDAYQNLEDIIPNADMFNIDRGDLSSAIGIQNIPLAQREIIKAVKNQNKKIFLATQFFHYMVDHPIPLIAEIDGFYNALEHKVDGIQLSEETAIGKYPEEILSTIRGMEKDFDK